jgi:glycosyltransferase involved in cell wall biosynthesis
VRILHLIDPHSPGGGACTLRLLAEPLQRLRSLEQDVIVIGSRWHADLARRCGVEPIGQLAPPASQPALARRALARAIRAREAALGPYDVIHAWTASTAALAVMAAPNRRRLATLAVGPLTGPAAQLFLFLTEQHHVPSLAASSAVYREYRSLGVDRRSISVLPPAVNPESSPGEDRAALRRRWGIDDSVSSTFVVGLLSEPVNWADARMAVNAVVRAAVTGRDFRLLVHHSAPRRIEAQRWAAKLGYRNLLIVDDEVAEPWRIVSGLDAALLIGGELNSMNLSGAGSPFSVLTGGGRRLRPMPGVMPLLWAMSAGVPVIAEASDAVKDIVHDGQSGLLVSQYDLNTASDRLIRLYDDPTIAGRIGMQARALQQKRFHVSAYCVRLKEAYQRLADGRAVRVVSDDDEPLVEHYQHKTFSWRDVEESVKQA